MPAWMRHLPQGVKGKRSQTQEGRGPSLECPQAAGLAQEARFSTSSLAWDQLGATQPCLTLPNRSALSCPPVSSAIQLASPG